MDRNTTSSSSRLGRNIKERDRRSQMRHLLSALASVLPTQPAKISAPKLAEEAADHVKQMHARIEELKQTKARAEGCKNASIDDPGSSSRTLKPVVDVKSGDGSIVQVNLITGLNNDFLLEDIIRILQEEGAEIISFSSQKYHDRIIYALISQAISSRIGMDILRLQERLRGVAYNTSATMTS